MILDAEKHPLAAGIVRADGSWRWRTQKEIGESIKRGVANDANQGRILAAHPPYRGQVPAAAMELAKQYAPPGGETFPPVWTIADEGFVYNIIYSYDYHTGAQSLELFDADWTHIDGGSWIDRTGVDNISPHPTGFVWRSANDKERARAELLTKIKEFVFQKAPPTLKVFSGRAPSGQFKLALSDWEGDAVLVNNTLDLGKGGDLLYALRPYSGVMNDGTKFYVYRADNGSGCRRFSFFGSDWTYLGNYTLGGQYCGGA